MNTTEAASWCADLRGNYDNSKCDLFNLGIMKISCIYIFLLDPAKPFVRGYCHA